ncbi:MAG TPA: thioredoxin domain-containing protein [Gemmataceae bacterium]|nr:thioredoxin domain-containing protein [Gemmataceae bacterium]
MPNRLINESSLYLRQHAHNPVDWYAWGPEAIERARELDRPIFLSIGYSSCHWCHVMEHESFEDEATADLLNAHFVSIKVDREERPDLDTIYMTALQAMTQEGGGWPLSVWLTPDLHPFYAGTYFPPENRYGRPGFKSLLKAIADAWANRRDDISRQSAEVVRFLNEHQSVDAAGELGPDLLQGAATALRRGFDPTQGGFGRAPKFPHAIELRLLLRIWKRFGDDMALHMVRQSLDRMAAGGICDQIGGGFHRYSTDERWLVPHFEKMLYDNALLTSAYVEAWQATREPEYRRVAEQTLDYVLREMTDPAGPFFSSQDADSEGVEGRFYVWTRDEIEAVLGPEDANVFCAVFDISPAGNWEGHNIPNRPKSWDTLSLELSIPKDDLVRRCGEMANNLYELRSKRVWPGRDEKVLTAWNGLMIAAFAQAGAAFDEPRFTTAATRAADYLLANLRKPDGRLYRTAAVGSPAKIDAYLEDYAYLIEAFLCLYQAKFDPRWVQEAVQLADLMVQDFADQNGGGFFYTAVGHEPLITRTKDSYDGSTPSGNAMAATALFRLATLTGRRDLREIAELALRQYAGLMRESPTGSGQMLIALDFHLGPVREIAIVGSSGDEPVGQVLSAIRGRFRPNVVVAIGDSSAGEWAASVIPLLRDRPSLGDVTTYICANFTCNAPVIGADNSIRAIESLPG